MSDPVGEPVGDVVTGEAVVLGLRAASFASRMLGALLDAVVLGIRVVRDDGGPVRFRHSVVRSLLGLFELWSLAGSPAIICALVTQRGKRVGDVLAGTYVVRERTAARHVPLPPMPAELAGWARTADIGRLPHPTTVAARQFLGRTTSLNPASRQTLAHSLADALLTHVSPAPPAGTNPERFVAAVLVENRDRELQRLQRREARTRDLERSIGRG